MKSTASLSRKIRNQHAGVSDEIPEHQSEETLPNKASYYSSLRESLLSFMSDHQRKEFSKARLLLRYLNIFLYKHTKLYQRNIVGPVLSAC